VSNQSRRWFKLSTLRQDEGEVTRSCIEEIQAKTCPWRGLFLFLNAVKEAGFLNYSSCNSFSGSAAPIGKSEFSLSLMGHSCTPDLYIISPFACSALHAFLFFLVSLLIYSSTLKMELICSSETSVYFCQTTWRYAKKHRTLRLLL
jgi:hypothetical protein